jgi:putative membrane protein
LTKVKEEVMFRLRSLIFATLLFGVSSTVAQTTGLSDSRIAHLVETAREIDLARADMALSKATNSEIKSFAQQIKRDHSTEKAEALESFSQQGVKPEENELSQSLSEVGAERSKELEELSGSAFDKAYLQNEIAYNVFIIGVLEVTALPSIKNPVLKRLIEARLGTFKAHMKDAETLLSNLK